MYIGKEIKMSCTIMRANLVKQPHLDACSIVHPLLMLKFNFKGFYSAWDCVKDNQGLEIHYLFWQSSTSISPLYMTRMYVLYVRSVNKAFLIDCLFDKTPPEEAVIDIHTTFLNFIKRGDWLNGDIVALYE